MRVCPKCNHEIDDEKAEFCPRCGSEVVERTESYQENDASFDWWSYYFCRRSYDVKVSRYDGYDAVYVSAFCNSRCNILSVMETDLLSANVWAFIPYLILLEAYSLVPKSNIFNSFDQNLLYNSISLMATVLGVMVLSSTKDEFLS